MKRRIEVEEEYKTKLKETEKLYKELKKCIIGEKDIGKIKK